MNAVDRWWNRHFPPYSTARLIFLIVATPIVGVAFLMLQEAVFGSTFDRRMYVPGLVLAEAAVIAGWMLARRERDRESGSYAGHRPDRSPPIPASTPSATFPTPRHPIGAPLGPSMDASVRPTAAPSSRDRWLTPQLDFFLSAAVFFGASLVTSAVIGLPPLGAPSLLFHLVAGVSGALILRFPFSPLTVIAICVAVGYPIATLLHLFFYFLSGDESIIGYWVFSSLMIAVFIVPPWQSCAHTENVSGGFFGYRAS